MSSKYCFIYTYAGVWLMHLNRQILFFAKTKYVGGCKHHYNFILFGEFLFKTNLRWYNNKNMSLLNKYYLLLLVHIFWQKNVNLGVSYKLRFFNFQVINDRNIWLHILRF